MQQWYLPPSNYSCVSGVAFFSNNTSQHLSMRLAQVSFVVSQAAWLSPLVAPYNIYNHIMTTTSTKTLILTVRITISVYICSTILRSTLIIVLHTGRRVLYNVPTREKWSDINENTKICTGIFQRTNMDELDQLVIP